MKRQMTFAAVILMCTAVTAQADVVGADPLTVEGTPDGWSGIPILTGYGELPAGQSVESVNYAANADRADGTRHVQPIIAKNEGGTYTIWEIGPQQTPAEGGLLSFQWSSGVIPDDGNIYHPAMWQWADGVDDDAGAMIPFGGDGGSGMFMSNKDGTSYVPAVGDELDNGHASGAGGRAYQFNFVTVPEPSTAIMAALALLPLICLRRRSNK